MSVADTFWAPSLPPSLLTLCCLSLLLPPLQYSGCPRRLDEIEDQAAEERHPLLALPLSFRSLGFLSRLGLGSASLVIVVACAFFVAEGRKEGGKATPT